MLTHEIRQLWLDFFAEREHALPPPASLVPAKDPTLLFTSAGMVQFKGAYLGTETYSYSRAATCQRCFRTSDLDNVGKTARHHTFFEMLGNFSFGDYFKEEAITWAWDYMTRVLPLDPDRLYVSIYTDDDEAYRCWRELVGIPDERIVRLGEDTNFWKMAETGPCGPCSEILYDMGEDFGCLRPECSPACECGRYLELWNLVFTQYDRQADGSLEPLPKKNIDTGAGLERIASVLQGAKTNFEIDIIRPLVLKAAEILGIRESATTHEERVSLNVIADHMRAMVFLIFDGVLPSNEGRGYLLRRILRRAYRRGSLHGAQEPFLYGFVHLVVNLMKDAYPDLESHSGHIARVVKLEEERFQETLSKGLALLDEIMESVSEQRIISGVEAFRLFDTFGFPVELTVEEAARKDWTVDMTGFEKEMEAQRERSRSVLPAFADEEGDKLSVVRDIAATEFTGYTSLVDQSTILACVAEEQAVEQIRTGDSGDIAVVLDKTSFYAESGGQVGDCGFIESINGLFEVEKVYKTGDGHYLHFGKVTRGSLSRGDAARCSVDQLSRAATERHHTATHLLQKALREVVGDHVHQSGSLVAPDRLRFDFSHYEPLTPEQIREVEKMVNEKIVEAIAVSSEHTSLQEAKNRGITALFGEKYTEQVRAVHVGDFSSELCGGTHVNNSGEIGLFKIVSESSIAQGVRRVEALAGLAALSYVQEHEQLLDEAAHELRCGASDVPKRVIQLKNELQEARKQKKGQADKDLKTLAEDLLKNPHRMGDITLYGKVLHDLDQAAMRRVADYVCDDKKQTATLLVSVVGGKALLVVKRTADIKAVHAGQVVKTMAAVVGGGGGGRPDMAQAGGPQGAMAADALKTGFDTVAGFLGMELKTLV